MNEDLTVDDICEDLRFSAVEIHNKFKDFQSKKGPREDRAAIFEFLKRETTPSSSFYLNTLSDAKRRINRVSHEDAEKLQNEIDICTGVVDSIKPKILEAIKRNEKKERQKPRLIKALKTTKPRMKVPASDVAKWAGVSLTQVYAWDNNPPYQYPSRNGDRAALMAWCREYKNAHCGKKKPGRKKGTGNAHLRRYRGDQIDLIADPKSTPLPTRKI